MKLKIILRNLKQSFITFSTQGQKLVQPIARIKERKDNLSCFSSPQSQPLQQPCQPSLSSSSCLTVKEEFPLQTDKRFPKVIKDFGCYFISIAKIAHEEGGFETSDIVSKILKEYEKALSLGYITDKLKILNPNKVFALFGLAVEYTDKWESKDRDCLWYEREILHFVNDNVEHFVVGNGKGEVSFDPYGNSKTVKEGYLKDKRIFKLIGRI
jgi:hypothetical protein